MSMSAIRSRIGATSCFEGTTNSFSNRLVLATFMANMIVACLYYRGFLSPARQRTTYFARWCAFCGAEAAKPPRTPLSAQYQIRGVHAFYNTPQVRYNRHYSPPRLSPEENITIFKSNEQQREHLAKHLFSVRSVCSVAQLIYYLLYYRRSAPCVF
jgi:hypothetical protein